MVPGTQKALSRVSSVTVTVVMNVFSGITELTLSRSRVEGPWVHEDFFKATLDQSKLVVQRIHSI